MKTKIFSAVTLVLSVNLAFAHSDATGAVKARMEGMKSIAAASKTLLNIAKEKEAFDASTVQETAETLRQHAVEIPKLFREKDLSKPTEAKAELWEEWPDFLRLSKELETAAMAAGEAKSPEELAGNIALISQNCKACHALYRVKK